MDSWSGYDDTMKQPVQRGQIAPGMALFQAVLGLALFLAATVDLVTDAATGNFEDGFYFKLFLALAFLASGLFFAVLWRKAKRAASNNGR